MEIHFYKEISHEIIYIIESREERKSMQVAVRWNADTMPHTRVNILTQTRWFFFRKKRNVHREIETTERQKEKEEKDKKREWVFVFRCVSVWNQLSILNR